MVYSMRKMTELNERFHEETSETIMAWAFEEHNKVILSTHFGPYEAVILHMASNIKPNVPIICVDHGYNTRQTYSVAEQLIERLRLNVEFYTPKVTAARQEVVYGGIPDMSDEVRHKRFVSDVKLEPFYRAFKDHQPDLWLTAIRQEQTEFRNSLDILSFDQKFQCLRVAPLFYWTENDLEEYLVEYNLPNVLDYFDPTKVFEHRECGLHLE